MYIDEEHTQQNGEKEKYKRTNNDLQNSAQKTKDRVTRTPRKSEVNPGAQEG